MSKTKEFLNKTTKKFKKKNDLKLNKTIDVKCIDKKIFNDNFSPTGNWEY